jgi:hypothetical protein
MLKESGLNDLINDEDKFQWLNPSLKVSMLLFFFSSSLMTDKLERFSQASLIFVSFAKATQMEYLPLCVILSLGLTSFGQTLLLI